MDGPMLAIVTLLAAQSGAQTDEPLAVFSFQDTSCGAYTKSAGNELVRAQYHYWFRGFVSGYNFGNPANQVRLERMPDSDTLSLYIDKYCRENPLRGFVGAAFDLVRELRDHSEGKDRKPGRRSQ
jgi:hypothetical protein